MKFNVGMLVLINHALARVEKVDADGFDFYCTNGAWYGRYDTTKAQSPLRIIAGRHRLKSSQ